MSVFIGGGQRLVLGGEATHARADADEFNPSQDARGHDRRERHACLPDNLITGGTIAGLLRFQSTDLRRCAQPAGQMAAALAGRSTSQQALGLDLGTPATAGAAIFSTGATIVQPSSSNAKDGAGNPIASYVNASGTRVPTVSFAITDATQLRASNYMVQADPATAGNYLVTRESDGVQVSVASGGTVDGFQLTVVAPLPAAGDRFELQPVASAALNMRRVLDDPKGIAAAAKVTAAVGASNTGTASVASVKAVSTTLNPNLTATVTFTSGAGNYDWELRDATTGCCPAAARPSGRRGRASTSTASSST
jgi:flagellar hook-associated protein 1 FlgK